MQVIGISETCLSSKGYNSTQMNFMACKLYLNEAVWWEWSRKENWYWAYVMTAGDINQPQIFVDIYYVSNTILAIEYKI